MKYWQEKQITCENLLSVSQIYETASGPIECASFGIGPAVLISHGGGGGYDMGLWLAKLIGGNFYYIAPSRFGYLRTPVPSSPTPETQADIFAELLDMLNINSTFIIGLSSGGLSALQFAIRHTDRCLGLIMLSAISRSLPPLPLVLRLIYPFLLKSDFIPWAIYSINPDFVYRANGVNRELLGRVKHDQEKMNFLDTLFQTTFPSSLRREGIVNDMRQSVVLLDYQLEQITTPTLVIHAIDDPIVPYNLGEFTARNIPGAQFLSLEEGGHFSCVTHREVAVPIIQKFLNRHGT